MTINTKVEEWKKRLLDIGRTNKLINYKELRVGSITIDKPNYKEVFNTLYTNDNVLEFIKKDEIHKLEENLEEILKEGQVITTKSDSELKKSLNNLRLRAKNSLEEQGVNILYLAIGFLEWVDNDNKKTKSPILLFPVNIIHGNIFENNKLKLSGDEVVLNPALRLKFESEYNIILENPTEDDLIDIDKYFEDLECIINNPMWKINTQVELGTFSFQKISMYKDFDEIENEIINNKVVEAVIGEEVEINSEEMVSSLEVNIDDINPNEIFQVLDADSSQQEAILAAKNGLSFVMQGPPGTGKSQTITNIIAECLSMGKSVLFVSEKLAALNVVYNRLKQVGLDEFCLQLHSNKSNKKEIIKELAETLSMPSHNEKVNYTNTLNNLYNIRQELNLYIKELHIIIEPFGKSLYEAYGMFSKYSEAMDLTFNYKYLEDFTEEKLSEYNNLITSYSSLYNIVKKFDKEDVWSNYTLDNIDEAQIKRNIEETIFNIKKKSNIIIELKEKFDLLIEDSVDSFNKLAQIMNVINECDAFELQLVSINDLENLFKILNEVRDLYIHVNELKSRIDEKYNNKVYDLDYLNIAVEAKNKEQAYRRFADKERIKIKDRKELSKLSNEKINFVLEFIKEINDTISQVNSTYNLNLSINIDELDSYKILLELILKDFKVNDKWFDTSTIMIIEKLIHDYRSNCSKLYDLKKLLLNDFDKDILEVGVKEILVRFRTDYSNGFKMFKPSYHKDIKLIKGFYRGNEKITDNIIIKALELCKDIKEEEVNIRDFENQLKYYLDSDLINKYTDWNSIDNSISIMKQINCELKKLGETHNETIKNIILSNNKVQRLSNVMEKVDYILNNKVDFNSFLELIFDKENNVNNINSIIQPFNELIKYKGYFNSTDIKLSEIVKNNENIVYEELKNDLINIKKIKELEYEIKEKENLIPDIILNNGYCYENISNVIESVDKGRLYKQNLERVKNNKVDLSGLYNNIDFKKYISLNISNILDISTKLNKSISCIKSIVNDNMDSLDKLNNDECISWLNKLLESISNIRVYRDYYEIKESIDSFGVTSIDLDELISNNSLEDILKAVNKRFIELWINYYSSRINVIRDFDKEAYNLKVKNFKVMDKEQFNVAKERLKHKLSVEKPKINVFANKNNEVNLLLHEANKKRMHLSIRKLISSIPNLIFKIKPCFLMSPLAVSSFLDVNDIRFDVVIFDEASQICPENAIGSMLRSKQVIIVGDSEQLPPTNFFTTTVSSENLNSDDSDELYESILDKCTSIMPTLNLKWHYRSRHEDLISFSNKSIYRNLITIPSAKQKTKDLGVEFIKVNNAYYERSGSRMNRKEAETVANLVFEHFKSMPDKSLGVVTFSESQSTAIESAIRSLREQNQGFEEMFSEDKKEPFFIKNIESVQGDERDVIIFSIGYGKDINGHMSMNFGPLSRSGGYRRLNVAITRAKYNVKVVSSIEPSDIDLSRTNAEGVRMLRAYMEFAKYGYLQQTDEDINIELNSTVEKSIYDVLINNGYKVDTYVGNSEYKINIAVKSPTDENKYILAIELDGCEYGIEPIARERYRLREELLYSMGWNFYRIWSTEWIRNREKVERELLSYLKEIIALEDEKEIYKDETINLKNIEDDSKSEYILDNYSELKEDTNVSKDKTSIVQGETIENKIEEQNFINKNLLTTSDFSILSNKNLMETTDFNRDSYGKIFEHYEIKDVETYESVVNDESILNNDNNVNIENVIIKNKIEEQDFINKNLLTTYDFSILSNKNLMETTDFDRGSYEKAFEHYEIKYVETNKNSNLNSIFDIKKKKIETIVRKEYPVHIKRVCEEVMELDNLYKVTNSYKEEILKFISKNIGCIEIKDNEFLWIKDSKEIKLRSDLPYKRKIEYICKEEIASAMIKILQEEGPKKKDDLFNAILLYFKEEYTNKLKQRYLINAIDLLFEEGKITLRHGEIKLRSYSNIISEESSTDNIINESKREVIIKENKEITEYSGEFNEKLKIENVFSDTNFNYKRMKINNINEIAILKDTNLISKEEIALAIIKILQEGPKKKSDLFNDVLLYFGEECSNKLNPSYLIKAIDLLFEEGKISLKHGLIKLRNSIKHINQESNISNVVKESKKIIEENQEIVESNNELNVKLKIKNIFSDDKFKSFRTFCEKKGIVYIDNLTDNHIEEFRWNTLPNRTVLFEINDICKNYKRIETNNVNEVAILENTNLISKEEIALAIIKILQEGPKKKDDLFNAVLLYFGEECSNKLNPNYLTEAIDLLFENGKISLKHGFIKLRNSIKLGKQNNNIAIKNLKDTITNKYNKLSSKQLLVAEYIVNNIENIPEIKSAVELGKITGVSSTTVGITLTILNLGSFNSFKSRIKKCYK